MEGVQARRRGGSGVGDHTGGPGGDDAAADFVRAVYAEHGSALLAFITRMTGDRAQAEDVLQETLVRAWRHSGRLGADGRPLRPWLFTVASRIVIDEHRARRARPAEVGAETLEQLPASNELDRAMESWQVAEAFRALSPEHRAALVETYYLGRSVAEAAATLGIPPGTVKSRVYYGLRALKLALEERGWAT
ncbi:ECF RNA polymerase sigma factor SigL [Frankia canadensis]|uniref:RNA polymerase sigma factor n=1 Tax=Frankia canadensis TaxID=1836972 RepID=A0A2I2KZT7_9ACTN|nr:sigma-70 family RNA polymerase sigma factor [Frankia canadensis]SNQ51181.1 ECF RNA polymerase sigma factor SigL [Frankia canadensis]SOU58471.1 ECF RNA polymerase sigma factor SigL [Frankia canadensis]